MHLLPPHVRRQAVLLSSNYVLYGDMSQRVTRALGEFSPHFEVYSIDESFVGFQGFDPATLEARGQRLRQTVRQWTGIPVLVGFAPTRVLAKVANHAAKKIPAFDGVCRLDSDSPRHSSDALPAAGHRTVGRGSAHRRAPGANGHRHRLAAA